MVCLLQVLSHIEAPRRAAGQRHTPMTRPRRAKRQRNAESAKALAAPCFSLPCGSGPDCGILPSPSTRLKKRGQSRREKADLTGDFIGDHPSRIRHHHRCGSQRWGPPAFPASGIRETIHSARFEAHREARALNEPALGPAGAEGPQASFGRRRSQ
jgi:hypothetical protein